MPGSFCSRPERLLLFLLLVGWERPPPLRVAPPPPETEASAVLRRALRYLGHPYALGGIGEPAFDCSGFVCRVYAESGWALPRVSRDQARAGDPVPLSELRPGDLVFFADPGRPVSHVGMYLGDGNLVHASSGRGEVVVADLSARWFRSRLVSARRVLTSTPSFALAEVTEVEEHRGASALLPMVDRPARFRPPRLGFVLDPLEGSGVGLRSLAASERGRVALVLAPEASLLHAPWGFELTLAAPVRFDPDPSVGAVESFADATRFLRTLRLGLPGARLELSLERVGTHRVGALVRDLSPSLLAAGLPGLSVARSPLTAFAAWRPGPVSLELLLDDVVDPGLGVFGLGVSALPFLELSAVAATDRPGTRDGVGLSAVDGGEVAAEASVGITSGMRLALRTDAQLLSAEGRVGAGARARMSGTFSLPARTTIGVQLEAGHAGPNFLFDLFGPTFMIHRFSQRTGLEAVDRGRAVVQGEAQLRRGSLAFSLGYGRGTEPRVQLDEQLGALVELGGLSLGGARVLSLRLAYTGRAPFAPDGFSVLTGSARLRITRWLSAEALVQAGERLEAGLGLSVAWVP